VTNRIHPKVLKGQLDNLLHELAILDVREQGVFAQGHLLFASNTPLSRLEIEVPRLVPRRSSPIVLYGDGNEREDLALRANELLNHFGYSNVSTLEGGVRGWRKAGYELFSGINVPSKAFGEFIEETCHTPNITSADLVNLRKTGTDMVILDSRPASEFQRMSLPDAINVPGAELIYRIREVAPNPDTLVVVNCAGRTRSIIGAQSLINIGLENKVLALKNGTMGWHLAGFELENGKDRRAPKPTQKNLAWAQNVTQQLAERAGVQYIDWETLSLWRNESEAHTLYLLDVRSPEEYECGHLPNSQNAPGGQLVQATDTYIGTLGARIVLIDDDGVRAKTTASWLSQMGRPNVYVLTDSIGSHTLETGPERFKTLRKALLSSALEVDPISLAAQTRDREIALLDVADSRTYKHGHIAGAWFTVRSQIRSCLDRIPAAPEYVLTSPCGLLAQLTAPDISSYVHAPVKVLSGGTDGWVTAGLTLVSGFERMAAEPNDVYWLPYDHEAEKAKHQMREYLSWETGLLPQIARDASARFEALASK